MQPHKLKYADPRMLRHQLLWCRRYLMLTAGKDNTIMSKKQLKAEIKQLRRQLYAEYRVAHYRLLCFGLIALIIAFVAAVCSGHIQL